MAGDNAQNGHDPRLDRVEAILERLATQQANDHERIDALVELAGQQANDRERINALVELAGQDRERVNALVGLAAQDRERINALVELAAQHAKDHERINALVEAQFASIDDFKALRKDTLTYQVLAADEFRTADEKLSKKIETVSKELSALGKETDRRIADLVAAIGQLIARMPPPPQH